MTTAGAGTSVRPVFALLSTATVTGLLREIQLWNTTQVACAYKVVHFTAGTAGADQAESRHRANAPTAICIAKGLWTADATIAEDTGYHVELGDAYGAAAIIYFGDSGLETRLGATAGVGLVPIATGQVLEAVMVWDE
jgi:hypothetical protein